VSETFAEVLVDVAVEALAWMAKVLLGLGQAGYDETNNTTLH
jgi:hypothetical protein